MATDLPSDLAAFHRFLSQQLDRGCDDLSPEACLLLWRSQAPTTAAEADIEAVKEALDDMNRGDHGVPIEEFIQKFCATNLDSNVRDSTHLVNAAKCAKNSIAGRS